MRLLYGMMRHHDHGTSHHGGNLKGRSRWSRGEALMYLPWLQNLYFGAAVEVWRTKYLLDKVTSRQQAPRHLYSRQQVTSGQSKI